MSHNDFALLYTTWPDETTLKDVARRALYDQLAACVKILGRGQSVYLWEGTTHEDDEVYALFKTRSGCVPSLIELITSHHPYEVPAIIELPVQCPTPGFAQFLREGTKEPC